MKLMGERSLFQNTLERMQPLGPVVVVTGAAHCEELRRQAAELGLRPTILVEPTGRDSAPAIAAAAQWIAAQDAHALAAVVASDHHIPDDEAFRDAIRAAAATAEAGHVVTFGVRPTSPQTAYGYLQAAEPLDAESGVRRLQRFVEKPDAATAESYLRAGFLWNSGNFLFHAAQVAGELQKAAPEVSEAVAAALEEAAIDGACVTLGPSFANAPKISFDYAFMESAEKAAVAPVDYDWSDLGAWDAVWEASSRDGGGNAVKGAARLQGSRDCLIRNDGDRPIVAIGLERIVVVADRTGLLICDMDSAQSVKTAVEGLPGPPARTPSPRPLDLGHWLRASALPVWWSLGADHERGGFHELLDLNGAPVEAPRRARVQARQIYAYATAGQMGWKGPWRAAVRHGLDYFLSRYRREDGLFRTLVSPEGAPMDETAPLYDQAFALLALASAATALPNEANRLRDAAERLRTELRRSRAHANGGFVEVVGPTPYQANPHMHLLEASLAWERLTGDPQWRLLSDHLVELCLAWFVSPDTGALHECFNADWTRLDGDHGRLVEPGHQFEWAWLLESWARRRRTHEGRQAARRLFAAGEHGVDPASGVAASVMGDDLVLTDASARLWPQTERIKAGAILAETESDPAQWATYRRAGVEAQQALRLFLETPTPGLWRDKRSAAGVFVTEPAPASSFYHIVCAIQEMERAAQVEGRRTPAALREAEEWTFGDRGATEADDRREPDQESERTPSTSVEA